jgi:hypothetical protein
VKFSVRSESKAVKANDLVRSVLAGIGFGGGHDHMAGGFMPAENMPAGRKLDTLLKYRAIHYVEQGARPVGP